MLLHGIRNAKFQPEMAKMNPNELIFRPTETLRPHNLFPDCGPWTGDYGLRTQGCRPRPLGEGVLRACRAGASGRRRVNLGHVKKMKKSLEVNADAPATALAAPNRWFGRKMAGTVSTRNKVLWKTAPARREFRHRHSARASPFTRNAPKRPPLQRNVALNNYERF